MEISKEILTAIREELPSGAQLKIASITGYNHVYVNMVLNGKVNINDKSKVVIEEAQKIIEKKRKEEKELTASLQKTITNKQ